MHKFFAKTQFLGKKVYFLPQCHSTNEEAQVLLKQSVIEGTTVITQNQTNGKGQRGNTWESQPGLNATFSTILKPTFIIPSQQFSLHLIVSLAVHDALFPILGKKLKIKWPNDVYYDDRKLGGILIENSIKASQIETAVVGVGININQVEFSLAQATSLKEITDHEFEVNEIVENVLVALETRYLKLKNGQIELLRTEYLARLFRFNQSSQYSNGVHSFEGMIVGISKTGLLQIQCFDEINEYDFKEINFIS